MDIVAIFLTILVIRIINIFEQKRLDEEIKSLEKSLNEAHLKISSVEVYAAKAVDRLSEEIKQCQKKY